MLGAQKLGSLAVAACGLRGDDPPALLVGPRPDARLRSLEDLAPPVPVAGVSRAAGARQNRRPGPENPHGDGKPETPAGGAVGRPGADRVLERSAQAPGRKAAKRAGTAIQEEERVRLRRTSRWAAVQAAGVQARALQADVRAFEGSCMVVKRAVVTPAIILACVAVYVVMVAAGVSPFNPSGEVLLSWGANFAPSVALDGETWRLFTFVCSSISA